MVIVQLLVILALHAYLPWRLGGLLFPKAPRRSARRVLPYAIFAVGLVSGIVVLPLVARFDNVFVNAYYNLTWTWYGAILFLTCPTLLFEVVNAFLRLPPVGSALGLLGFAGVLALYSFFNALSFNVVEVSIPIRGLREEMKIVQISDVHLGAARGGAYLGKIVAAANVLNPDFVAITGDIADGRAALRPGALKALGDIRAPAYFVSGNHEAYIGRDEILSLIKGFNVTVLQNEVVAFGGVKLVGLNYMKADDSVYDPHQVSDETIKDILPTLDLGGDMPKIVLHHGPWGVEYMNRHGVDLVLAGHTHGGQIFPVNLLAGLFFPYNSGLSDYMGTQIYVSQGAGTFMPRMRLGTKNEIAHITLVPAPGR